MPKKGKTVKAKAAAAGTAMPDQEVTAEPVGAAEEETPAAVTTSGAATSVEPAVEAAAATSASGAEGRVDSSAGRAAGTSRTFTAPSGKHYVLAQEQYPTAEELCPELRQDVVAASDGDLLELLIIQDGWAYGRRFKAREGAVNEGVFRLDWVQGVRLVLEGGQRRPVEIDIASPEFGFRQATANDTAGKLRIKRYRKKVEDAAKAWSKAGFSEAATTSAVAVRRRRAQADEVAAARAAEALEKGEEQQQKAKRAKAELKRAQQQKKLEQQEEEEQQRRQQQLQLQQQQLKEQQQKMAEQAKVGGPDLKARPSSPPRPASPRTPPGRRRPEEEADSGCRPAALQPQPLDALPPSLRQLASPLSERTWEAQWEQQAAHLESVLSASSSGIEEGADGSRRRRPTVQKKMLTRKVARSLLEAKRSGELHAIAEEWEKAHSEMASKASDMSALNAKVKRSLLDAHRVGDLEKIAEEMVGEAERKAAEVKALKERVFRAMIDMKRARDLERTTSDMDDAQKELEMKALQLKNLMKKAWQGMVESRRTRELERIADEMAEQLQTKAEALKHKIREGLLRAHRTGELREIRDELDELADSVAVLDDEAAAVSRGEARGSGQLRTPTRRRWADFPSSDSDSSFDPVEAARRRRCRQEPGSGDGDRVGGGPLTRLAPRSRGSRLQASPGEADCSGSETAESSPGGQGSPGPGAAGMPPCPRGARAEEID